MGIRVRKVVAVGHLVHKYDEIICSIHQKGEGGISDIHAGQTKGL